MDSSVILKIDQKLYTEKKEIILEMFMTEPEEMKKMLQLMVTKIPSLTLTILKIIIDLKSIKDIDMTNSILEFFNVSISEKQFYDAISTLRILNYLEYLGFLIIKKIIDEPEKFKKIFTCEALINEIENLKNEFQNNNFSSDHQPKEVEINSPELNEFINSIPDNVTGDMICYRQIIHNFEFDRNSCVLNLLKYSNNYEKISKSIIWYYNDHKSEIMYLISIMTSLYKEEKFLEIFMKEANCSDLKSLFLAILFEQKEIPEDELADFITSEDLKTMIKICNLNFLKKFLNKFKPELRDMIPENKFEFQDDVMCDPADVSKDIFLKQFCRISRYSITHFLTYLEKYQDYFDLNDEEQEMFVRTIFEVNSNPVYLRVVLEKLKKFDVVGNQVFEKYQTLLN
ncbi:hypothetical protein DMUE_2105 [Dictyocoela muelleri]|nr:hypothetical protein DMUE_2105 [Dictyocoela muelleri]